MRQSQALRALLGFAVAGRMVQGLADTDSILDGDSAQTGYADNHNMDPAIISSDGFGQLWRYKTPAYTTGTGDEQFYAKPLLYTPPSYGRQILLAFSEQNRLFALDAVNGTLIAFRNLDEEGEGPFNVADFDGGCNDISDTIGITGTPVIDPDTDTVYFWAKGYEAGTSSGLDNVRYRFHAVDAITLEERPGFPTLLDGHHAVNDATRYFQGGIQLQRTALNLLNGVVYAGFGADCDQGNFTGWVLGTSPADGSVITAYATSAGTGAPPVPDTSGAGIWMAGAILASDQSDRFFFATGNGYTSTINSGQAASGRTQLDTLSECVVNMRINDDGTITQQDYFEPAAYAAMDGADRDLGSGGVTLLTSPFSGGGVNNIAIACGKNGQCFVMNADNLGGYKNGAASSDDILQTITPPSGAAMFGTVASYPLEGGYIYIAPSGAPVYAYALGFDSAGRPQFTYAGETATSTTGRPAVSGPAVTSLDGQAGTGILWIVDPDNGINAYNAVPQDGVLVPITIPASGAVSKFQRLVFGDGRYYTTAPGYIVAYGSPVTLPLNCTGPVDFGDVYIGSTSSDSVSCIALIDTTVESLSIGSVYYSFTSSSTFPLALTTGEYFSISITFNLTRYSVSGGGGTTALVPGSKSGALTLTLDNAVAEYASSQSVSLTGNAMTDGAYASVNPLQVDFGAVVVSNTSAGPVSGGASDDTFVISNIGEAVLEILGYAYTNTNPAEDETVYTNLTSGDNATVLDSNGYFTTTELPALDSTIAAGSSLTVEVSFNTNTVGTYFTILCIWTSGGMVFVTLNAAADSQPTAKVYYSDGEGGWTLIPNSPDTSQDWPYTIDFGTGLGATDQTITLLVANTGGSDLVITKSKPPESTYLSATNPDGDLTEGLEIAPGTNSTATIYFEPPAAVLNAPAIVYAAAWTLNFNDLTWGVHVLNFTGTIKAAQVGPELSDGSPRFQYLACYLDSTAGRIESSGTTDSNNNSIGYCQDEAYAHTAAFAGVEYSDECYWGDSIPSSSLLATDANCEGYTCAGDTSQYCGGPGGYISIWYDTTAYFPSNGTLAPGYLGPTQPATVSGQYFFVGCYGDDSAARALSGLSPGLGSSNSLENCAAACAGYTYFGTEYSDECYCGDSINVEAGSGVSGKNQTSGCDMLCAGNQNEYCGGPSRLSLYALDGTNDTASMASTSTVLTTASTNGAIVATAKTTKTTTTTTSSLSATPTPTASSISCPTSNGTIYTALNGATFLLECYLDRDGGDLTVDYVSSYAAACEACSTTDSCVALSWLPGVNNPNYMKSSLVAGVVNDGVWGARLLSSAGSSSSSFSSSASSSSASLSIAAATATVESGLHAVTSAVDASLTLSSVHVATSITGRPVIHLGTTSSLDSSSTLSQSPSKSTSSITGRPVVSTSSPLPITSTVAAESSLEASSQTNSAALGTTSTASSTISSLPTSSAPAGWSYIGCLNDNTTASTASQALQGASLVNSGMTVTMCTTYCAKNQYPYAGVESSKKCYCGPTLFNSAATELTTCGGENSGGLSIYQSTTQPLPVLVNATSVDGWNTTQRLLGCFSLGDSTDTPTSATTETAAAAAAAATSTVGNTISSRITTLAALTGYTFTSAKNMTVENCISGCKDRGFAMSGVSGGTQCYCGDSIAATTTATASLVSASAARQRQRDLASIWVAVEVTDCEAVMCSGNRTEFCAGQSRVAVYV